MLESLPPISSSLNINFSYWFLQTLAMIVTAILIPGLKITSIFGALFCVIGLALVNAHMWDAALFFSVPDNVSLQTLFLLGANGVIFWLLVKLLPGIEISGIFAAILAPVVFTVCSILISQYGQDIEWKNIAIYIFDLVQSMKQQLIKPTTNSVNLLVSKILV